MSVHLARAQLLLQQGRPADAEQELLLTLAQSPESPLPHALLALSRVDQNKSSAALESARAAIGLAPDTGYFHYVHALILHRADRDTEALAAIGQAIRLDPEDEEGFALLASIHLARRNWTDALAAAEHGLALNAEHVGSANLRAMALVRLGRKAEAAQTVDFALERAPENAFSHANQGWNCLHQNDPHKAQEHFREALRLEPDLEYARNGMLEALKAQNPVYRAMLAYFLWIGRQNARLQWAFIIGTYLIFRFVLTLTARLPILWVVVAAFYLFIYLSWTAGPMFNLLLRLHPFGRYVLSRDERIGSYWFGSVLLTALAALVWLIAGGGSLSLVVFVMTLILSVCVAATFSRTGRNRLIFAGLSLGLAGVGLLACLNLANGHGQEGNTALVWFSYGFLGIQILANFLGRK